MRFRLCLPLLFVTLVSISINATPMNLGRRVVDEEFGGWMGGGGDTSFNKNSPPCDVHFGPGNIDGVHRTNNVNVEDTSTDRRNFHSWQGQIKSGNKQATLFIKSNMERKLEISIANNYNIDLPGKVEVTMYAVAEVVNPPKVKYYLNPHQSLTCLIDTGHTPGFWGAINVMY